MQSYNKNKIDITHLDSISTDKNQIGAYHPVNIIQDKIEDIFLSMGFEVLDGLISKTSFIILKRLISPPITLQEICKIRFGSRKKRAKNFLELILVLLSSRDDGKRLLFALLLQESFSM